MRWVAQLIAWGATLVLVRLLSPSDYGAVAVAMTLVSWLTLAADLGISGTIGTGEVLPTDRLRRLLGLLFASGSVLAIALWAAAPLASRLLRAEALKDILPALAVCVLLDSARTVLGSVLTRRLENRSLATIELVRSTASTLTVFGCAMASFGYWSLVAGQVVSSILGLAMLVAKTRLLPSLPSRFEWQLFRERGKHFLVTSITWQSYTNADSWVISRVLGPGAVGAYSLARTLVSLPNDKLVTVITSVSNGYFANLKDDRDRLARMFLALTHAIGVVVALPLAGLFATADIAVPVLLGPNWSAAIAPLRFMCLGALIWSVSMAAFQVGSLSKDIRMISMSSSLAVPVSFLSYFVASRYFGVAGVAAAWNLVVCTVAAPSIILAVRSSGCSFGQYARAMRDASLVVVCVLGATGIARLLLPSGMDLRLKLLTLSAIGGSAGIAVLWRSESVLIGTLRERISTRVVARVKRAM